MRRSSGSSDATVAAAAAHGSSSSGANTPLASKLGRPSDDSLRRTPTANGSRRSSVGSRPMDGSLYTAVPSGLTSTKGVSVLEERTRFEQSLQSGQWCIALTDAVLTRTHSACELPQRMLGCLPCLHAAPPAPTGDPAKDAAATPHGSGNPLVAAVESLNLRNNSIVRLAAPAKKGPAASVEGSPASTTLEPRSIAPCSLAAFTHLTSIDLTNNELVTLSGVEVLPHLTSLRAARNSITSLAPLWLSPHVGRLELLEVSANRLGDIITPAEVAKLKARKITLSLRSLAATSNSIREIPDTFRVFSKLEVLKLRRNKIVKVTTAFPACCPALTSVDLNTNRLDEKTEVAVLRARTKASVILDLENNNPAAETTPPEQCLLHGEEGAAEDLSSSSLHASQRSNLAASTVSPSPLKHLSPASPLSLALTKPVIANTRPPSHTLRPLNGNNVPTAAAAGVTKTGMSAPASAPKTGRTEAAPTSRGAGLANPLARTSSASPTNGKAPSATDVETGDTSSPPPPPAVIELQGVSHPAVNVWEINVAEVSTQLTSGLVKGVGKTQSRNAPAAAWSGAPRLLLTYADANVITTPPALQLHHIGSAATKGAACRNLVHFILRGVVMERETMLTRALKRYDEKMACTSSALSPSAGAQVLVREPSSHGANGFPALLVVDHTFVDEAAHPDDPWPYLRWRREWETQAAARGLRVENHFFLRPATPSRRASSATQTLEAPPPAATTPQAIPEAWERLYDVMLATSSSSAGAVGPAMATKMRSGTGALRRGPTGAPPHKETPSVAWDVPASREDAGTAQGSQVAWPAPMLARGMAGGNGAFAPLLTQPTTTTGATTGSASVLELAMGTLATIARARAEAEAEAERSRTTTASTGGNTLKVFTAEEVAQNKRERGAALLKRKRHLDKAVAATLGPAAGDRDTVAWDSLVIDIPCAPAEVGGPSSMPHVPAAAVSSHHVDPVAAMPDEDDGPEALMGSETPTGTGESAGTTVPAASTEASSQEGGETED